MSDTHIHDTEHQTLYTTLSFKVIAILIAIRNKLQMYKLILYQAINHNLHFNQTISTYGVYKFQKHIATV